VLVKRYVQKPGTEAVLRLFRTAPAATLWISALASVELRSVLRMARKQGRLTGEQAQAAWLAHRADREGRLWVWYPGEEDWDRAADLVERYALRPGDAVQASATISCVGPEANGKRKKGVFVVSDRRLAECATDEGLHV
jgi:predicted nucleic acid-binding protein